MKILVVDDEIMQLKGIKIGLRTEKHLVVTALSAEAAIKIVKADPAFDLIITDYLMAGNNGLDLLKGVREILPFIPVILMTAFGKKDLVIEALRNQCSGFIEKPFSFEQLLSEIARVEKLKTQIGNYHALEQSLVEIVHQINNPLTAIKGNADLALLHCQEDPLALQRNLKAIVTATNNISEINKKILNLHMAKHENATKEKINMKWLLDDCLNMFAGLMVIQKISLEKKMEGDLPQVFGDRFGLQQVFRNLIMNAIEAMEGKLDKQLTVTTEIDQTDSWVSVHIADTGCGVPQAFSREFFNTGTTTKKNGSGLGLRVVKGIVDCHEGQLSMSSQEGFGTTIKVTLPAAKHEVDQTSGRKDGRHIDSRQETTANQNI